MLTCLQEVAHVVVLKAQQRGFVRPHEIRAELRAARLAEDLWQEVATLAQPILSQRQGRFYYAAALSPREEQEQHQAEIRRNIRQLIRHYRRECTERERRRGQRLDYIQSVKVRTEDGREWTLLSRDISTEGIQLIGTRSLLGQRIRVKLPGAPGSPAHEYLVRILWTCAVGDELFENGGAFLEVLAPEKTSGSESP